MFLKCILSFIIEDMWELKKRAEILRTWSSMCSVEEDPRLNVKLNKTHLIKFFISAFACRWAMFVPRQAVPSDLLVDCANPAYLRFQQQDSGRWWDGLWLPVKQQAAEHCHHTSTKSSGGGRRSCYPLLNWSLSVSKTTTECCIIYHTLHQIF